MALPGENMLHDPAYYIVDHRVYLLALFELYIALGRILPYAINVCRLLP